MKKMIVNVSGREKRYAVLENNVLVKLDVIQPEQESIAGNIYLGIVTKILPGMDAVFVDIGMEKHGFLHRDQLPSFQLSELNNEKKKKLPIGHFIRQGEKIPVQIVREATGTKGPKLSGIIELSSDKLVCMFGTNYIGVSKKMQNEESMQRWRKIAQANQEAGEGFIIRTSMELETEENFIDELNALRQQWKHILKDAATRKKAGILYKNDGFIDLLIKELPGSGGEIIVDEFHFYHKLKSALVKNENQLWTVSFYQDRENIFSSFGIEKDTASLLKKTVWLKNGMFLIIEETEACTVIDVNTGSFIGKSQKETTITEANLAAAREIAHQLRLRNIGGIVIIDFINMNEEQNKRKVMEALKEACKEDEKRIQITGFTELGILQLTRKKTSPTLREKLTIPCPICHGNGRAESAESIAFKLERELLENRYNESEAVWLETTSKVVEVLIGSKAEHQEAIEQLIGKKLYFTLTNDPVPAYMVRQYGSTDEIRERINKEQK